MPLKQNITIEILEHDREVFSIPLRGDIEIGRQRVNELEPYQINRAVNPPRLIIAPLDELGVSRSHALVRLQEGNLFLENISSQAQIEIVTGRFKTEKKILSAGQSTECQIPLRFTIGNRDIQIKRSQATLVGLKQITMPPSVDSSALAQSLAAPSIEQLRSQSQMGGPELMSWLRTILNLFQGTPNTDEFYMQATSAMAKMLDLDLAAVVFHKEASWKVRFLYQENPSKASDQWEPSLTILDEVRTSIRAHRQIPSSGSQRPESLLGAGSLVAAPILTPDGQVIGALYGDKRNDGTLQGRNITEIETMFVELLASGIAAGLARLQQEKEAVKARVRFEQFFPKNLVEKLENDQEFLKGRESEVTVLFCDIRKFSEIAERVGPEITVQFINDVMEELSHCVQENQGVLVDYIGDELIAMWGAPDWQPSHATMATQAARDMLAKVPELGERWNQKIGREFKIGIGLNSGIAQVGNIGSKVRFKYGPLGTTVNVASRVQGVTRKLQIPLLVTLQTAQQLGPAISYRKLCQVKLIHMKQPVTVCEVCHDDSPDWPRLKTNYERALSLFESASYQEACNVLSELLKAFPDDTPAKHLLTRSAGQLSGNNPIKDPNIWILDSK